LTEEQRVVQNEEVRDAYPTQFREGAGQFGRTSRGDPYQLDAERLGGIANLFHSPSRHGRRVVEPERLIGDMAYGNVELLGWMGNAKGIAPHVPVWHKTQRDDGTLSSSDFEWNEQAKEYRCPQGQPLRSEWQIFRRPRTRITKANTIIYRASQAACSKCPMKAHCCPHAPNRKIARSVHEAARDVARAVAKTDAYKQSRKDRKKVEMLFAHLKRILRLDRLRLRGPNGAHDEFLLAAIAQALRRMAKWLFSAEREVPSMAI
jgi:hypothetical protein